MRHKILKATDTWNVGIGTYGHGEAYGGISKENFERVFQDILAVTPPGGKLFVDTAPRYGCGTVEQWLGELPAHVRERLLIATKGGRHIDTGRVNEKDFSPEFLTRDLEGSLQRLQQKSIFLYQLHNPSLNVIMDGSVFDLMEEFRAQGKIHYYGVSINEPKEGFAAIASCNEKGCDGLAALQVIYNPLVKLGRQELFEFAEYNGITCIIREPLLRGFLGGNYLCTSERDMEKKPPAVRKEVNMYGYNQLFRRVREFMDVAESCQAMSPAEVALSYGSSRSGNMIIPGINHSIHSVEDLWFPDLDSGVQEKLNAIPDLISAPKTQPI